MSKIACFYSGTKRRSPVLDLYVLQDGRTTLERTVEVPGKRAARKLAIELGYVAWNF